MNIINSALSSSAASASKIAVEVSLAALDDFLNGEEPEEILDKVIDRTIDKAINHSTTLLTEGSVLQEGINTFLVE